MSSIRWGVRPGVYEVVNRMTRKEENSNSTQRIVWRRHGEKTAHRGKRQSVEMIPSSTPVPKLTENLNLNLNRSLKGFFLSQVLPSPRLPQHPRVKAALSQLPTSRHSVHSLRLRFLTSEHHTGCRLARLFVQCLS